ncbi:MAG: lipopolysaccharide heptosyltransferase II [Candidatus Paceibacteria bacterium]|jgi:lipopolysaccharide heptosyltransferase II
MPQNAVAPLAGYHGVSMPTHKPSIAIQRLQRVDRTLGWLVCAALQPWRLLRRLRRRGASAPVGNVLLIKFWGIGSLQLLTPAAQVLRERHAGARFTLLTLRANESFARGLEVFDEVRSFDSHATNWWTMALRIVHLVRDLRASQYDIIYDFEFFTRFSAVVSFLASAKHSVGFCSSSTWRGKLHTADVTFNRYWHVARNFRALAGGENGAGIPFGEFVPYQISAEEQSSASARLGVAGVGTRAYIVLNPNAGLLSLERRWSRANFASLARQIREQTQLPILLVGSKSEMDYTAGLRALVMDIEPERLVNLCGELSTGELCAVLKGARAVITNDSGPMHLAAALGAPTLGLFGPETPLMYEPLGSQADYIYRPTICSPCINVHQGKVATCIHDRPECLANITVHDVWSWLNAQLGITSVAPRSALLRVVER